MTDLSSPKPLSAPRVVPPFSLDSKRAIRTGLRRNLQLVLAGIWLLDGILQFQPVMFTKNFAPMIIYPTIAGNPSAIVSSMTWSQRIITDHPVGTNAAFASIQLVIGLAIALRPTARLGLAASIPWAIAVWWFGEGFGGVLSGNASPITGAPGAVILYALLAVLLWPTDRDREAPFQAAAAIGAHAARALWLVLWGSLAYFAIVPANSAPDAISGQLTAMVDNGQSAWLASLMNHAGNVTAGRGYPIAVTLTVLLAVTAVSVYLPWSQARKAGLVLAIVLAALFWVFGEAFGGVFTGMATDPNTGPLLALLAIAYWPIAHAAESRTAKPTPSNAA